MERFEVRWIHPLMSVARCPYLVVAEFCSRVVAEQLADDFKRFYSDCYFEVVPVKDV